MVVARPPRATAAASAAAAEGGAGRAPQIRRPATRRRRAQPSHTPAAVAAVGGGAAPRGSPRPGVKRERPPDQTPGLATTSPPPPPILSAWSRSAVVHQRIGPALALPPPPSTGHVSHCCLTLVGGAHPPHRWRRRRHQYTHPPPSSTTPPPPPSSILVARASLPASRFFVYTGLWAGHRAGRRGVWPHPPVAAPGSASWAFSWWLADTQGPTAAPPQPTPPLRWRGRPGQGASGGWHWEGGGCTVYVRRYSADAYPGGCQAVTDDREAETGRWWGAPPAGSLRRGDPYFLNSLRVPLAAPAGAPFLNEGCNGRRRRPGDVQVCTEIGESIPLPSGGARTGYRGKGS